MKADRIASSPARRLVGLKGSFNLENRGGIPALWERWDYGALEGIVGDLVYGVSFNFAQPGEFDYLCAMEVEAKAPVPPGQTALSLPGGDYAVFVHNGHVSGIDAVFDAVTCGTPHLPAGWCLAPGPQFELYGEGFDPKTASGRLEIWFPARRNS